MLLLLSLEGWELGSELLSFSGFLLPAGSDGLPLSVESNCTFTVEVGGSPHGGLVSSEGEHWEWDWDWQVDTDLTGLNLGLILTGGVSVLCEDRGTVTPWVGVDKINSLLEGVNTDDVHDWSEDFLLVAFHIGSAVVNDGWSNPVSVWISVDLDATTVEQKFSVLLTVGDQSLNLSQVISALEWSNIVVFESWTNLEGLGLLNKLWYPLLSVTDEDDDRDGHAALTSGAEASTSEGIESILLLAVWHDNGVVLGSHVDLAALTSGRSTGVDVFTSSVGTNEGNGLDVLMVTNSIDSVVSTMNNIDNTIWHTGLLQEINHDLSGAWNLLGWLEEESVTEGDGKWVHPEWDHGWEVVWGNTSNNTEWFSEGVDVDTGGSTLDGLSHLEGVEGASVLNAFVSTEDITSSVNEGLTVLSVDFMAQSILVLLEELLILEHVADTGGDWNLLPGLEGVLSASNSLVELGLGGLWDLADNVLGHWANDIDVMGGLGVNPLTVDVVL